MESNNSSITIDHYWVKSSIEFHEDSDASDLIEVFRKIMHVMWYHSSTIDSHLQDPEPNKKRWISRDRQEY